MEQLADSICASLETLETLVKENALDARAGDFAAIRRSLYANTTTLLAHTVESERTMAALRVYERSGAKIDAIRTNSAVAVFLTQIRLATTLRDVARSATLTPSVPAAPPPDHVSAAASDEPWTGDFLTHVVRFIGTGNDINDVHEFRKLMTSLVALCGSWFLGALCIDVSKYKEVMFAHRLERVYSNLPDVVRAITHWHAHSGDDDATRDSLVETMYTVLPRRFVVEETPILMTASETRSAIESACAALDAYTTRVEALTETLGSMMQRFRVEIRTSALDEALRTTPWSLLTRETCRRLVDAFDLAFAAAPAAGALRASSVGFKTKFKELIAVPFKKNEVWFETERDKMLVNACICFICMFIESTYFVAHEHDRWLYNVPLSKTDHAANDAAIRTILLDPSSITISIRKNAAKRVSKKKHMLMDMRAFSSQLKQTLEPSHERADDPRSPFFWTTERLRAAATHPSPWTLRGPAPPESFWHAPPYHSRFTTFPSTTGPLTLSSEAFGYGVMANGRREPLTIEPIGDSGMARDDIPEAFLWRPQRIVYAFPKEEALLRERDYAHIGRTSAFATVAELCATSQHAFTRLSWNESPLDVYCRTVLHSHPQLPFQPFTCDGFNAFVPAMASEYMATVEEARKTALDHALNMYCMRAWLQYYCILNQFVARGTNGQYLFPFSVRMLVPDADINNGGRSHAIVRLTGKPSEWVAISLAFPSSVSRREAAHRLAHAPGLSLEDYERFSFSMGSSPEVLVIAFPASDLAGCKDGVPVSIGEDGAVRQGSESIGSTLSKTILRCACASHRVAVTLEREPDCAKQYALFSTEVSRGIPNLFEFVLVNILVSNTHAPASKLPVCCPGGAASLSDAHRRCMIPFDSHLGPLYDIPFFTIETAKGRLVGLDATLPMWKEAVLAAYHAANVQLTHTYAAPMHNMPTAVTLYPESQLRSRLVGMVLRAMMTVYTFNPITFANEDMAHKTTETLVIKMDKSELAFTHDVRARSAQAGAAHHRAKLAKTTDGGASRTGTKQVSDAFYISSPLLALDPLVHYEALHRSGTMDHARLERFLTAFGYQPPGVSHLDVAERDSPVFALGHAHYARTCLASAGFMRFVFSRSDGKGRSLHFSGLADVADLDTRGASGAFVAELSARIAPAPVTGCGSRLFLPGGPIPFDVAKASMYARIVAHTREAHMLPAPWVHTHTFPGAWGLYERRDAVSLASDVDAMQSLTLAVHWATTVAPSRWEAITACAHLARFVCTTRDEYNATLQARLCLAETTDVDALYKHKCVDDARAISSAMLKHLAATVCASECVPLCIREDATLLCSIDVASLVMTETLVDVMAFLVRVALLQTVCNILVHPEYHTGILECVHAHTLSEMMTQINTIGCIAAPHDTRASYEPALIGALRGHTPYTAYYSVSVQNESRLGVEFQRILRCVYSCGILEQPSRVRVHALEVHTRKRKVDVSARAKDPDPMTEARQVVCKETLRTIAEGGCGKPALFRMPPDEAASKALDASSRFRMSGLTLENVNAFRASLWTATTGGSLNAPRKTLHAKYITRPLYTYVDPTVAFATHTPVCRVACRFNRAREARHGDGATETLANVFATSSRHCAAFASDETFAWDIFVFVSPNGGKVLFDRDVVEIDAKCVFEYRIGTEETIGYTAALEDIATPVVVERGNGAPRLRLYRANVMSSVDADRSKSTLRNTHDNTAHFAIIVVEDARIIQIQHQICIGVK